MAVKPLPVEFVKGARVSYSDHLGSGIGVIAEIKVTDKGHFVVVHRDGDAKLARSVRPVSVKVV